MTSVLFAGKAKKRQWEGRGKGAAGGFQGEQVPGGEGLCEAQDAGAEGTLRAPGDRNTFPTSARTSLDRLPLYCSPRDPAPAWPAGQATALPPPVRRAGLSGLLAETEGPGPTGPDRLSWHGPPSLDSVQGEPAHILPFPDEGPRPGCPLADRRTGAACTQGAQETQRPEAVTSCSRPSSSLSNTEPEPCLLLP